VWRWWRSLNGCWRVARWQLVEEHCGLLHWLEALALTRLLRARLNSERLALEAALVAEGRSLAAEQAANWCPQFLVRMPPAWHYWVTLLWALLAL
jgi:hypothetical protein